jgi:hypothetical protein
MISRSGIQLLARCLLGPRHCAIAIVVVDVSPSTTLVNAWLSFSVGWLAGCSLASESARP